MLSSKDRGPGLQNYQWELAEETSVLDLRGINRDFDQKDISD